MALAPKLTTEGVVRALEDVIDQVILQSTGLEPTLEVDLLAFAQFKESPRVTEQLKQKYLDAGWGNVSFTTFGYGPFGGPTETFKVELTLPAALPGD